MTESMTHNAAPSLHDLLVEINSLKPDPRNARSHDERSIAAIADSLRQFGQDLPLVASSSNRIVYVGNGRLAAAKKLGWTHIAVVFRDDDQIKMAARAIADNKTGELSTWNEDRLAEIVRILQEQDAAMLIGWTSEEAKVAARLHDNNTGGAIGTGLQEPPKLHKTCPRCQHRWSPE